MQNHLKILCAIVTLSTALGYAAPSMAEASGGGSGSGSGGGPSVSQQDRANEMRQQSKRSAQRDLGYPTVPYWDNYPPELIDFVALSMQIQNLAAHLQAIAAGAAAAAAGQTGPVIPGAPRLAGQPSLNQTYGPEGPTVDSVRAVLEYRLMVAGNKRLEPGKTTDEGDAIRTQIVTQGGSVVDEYVVDKKTGSWTRVQ